MSEIAEEDESFDAGAAYGRPRAPESPSQVYSIRIPVDRLEELRLVATKMAVAPSVLIRRWVLERLDAVQSNSALMRGMRIPVVPVVEQKALGTMPLQLAA